MTEEEEGESKLTNEATLSFEELIEDFIEDQTGKEDNVAAVTAGVPPPVPVEKISVPLVDDQPPALPSDDDFSEDEDGGPPPPPSDPTNIQDDEEEFFETTSDFAKTSPPTETGKEGDTPPGEEGKSESTPAGGPRTSQETPPQVEETDGQQTEKVEETPKKSGTLFDSGDEDDFKSPEGTASTVKKASTVTTEDVFGSESMKMFGDDNADLFVGASKKEVCVCVCVWSMCPLVYVCYPVSTCLSSPVTSEGRTKERTKVTFQ